MSIESRIAFHPEIFKIMGNQLVSDPIIAISELVKNSYDADATKVEIYFKTEEPRSIIIKDNGHGMTLEDIEKGWLVIGTPKKRERIISKYKGRTYSGSMGVGRLAAYTLADNIEITTTSYEKISYLFELNMDEVLKLDDITDYKVNIKKIDNLEENGTILKLTKLKWDITEDTLNIEKLKIKLSLLCSPFNKEEFSIIFYINKKKYILNPIQELPSPPITIESSISDSSVGIVKITGNKYLFKGKLEKETYNSELKNKYEYLKEVKLLAYWYPLGYRPDTNYWEITTRQSFQREMREEYSGVKIYRNGIRVLPYGDPSNDWLELERTYVSFGASARYPRRVQIVAWIEISRKNNSDLIDTANREGLIDNNAFKQLKSYGKDVISLLAEYRRQIEPTIRKPQVINLENTKTTEKAINKVKEAVIQEKKLQKEVSTIENYFSAFTDELQKEAIYRDRLTAGNLVAHIIHDVGGSVKRSQNFIFSSSKIKCNEKDHEDSFTIITDLLPRISSAYDLLKGGSRAGADKISKVNVQQIVNEIVKKMSLVSWYDTKEKGDILLKDEPIIAKVREADIWAIITNFLLNSITCAEFEHAREVNFPSQREIILEISKRGSDLVLICEDNGPGLPKKPPEWFWKPFNSTRLGGGSGLGLFIISDIVNWYGGTKIAQRSKRFSTGAYFEVTLKGVVLNE